MSAFDLFAGNRNHSHAIKKAELVRLCEQQDKEEQENKEQSSQLETKGHRRQGGINKAARQLDKPRASLHRSVNIDSLSEAAKTAIKNAGLDSKQSVMLQVAKVAKAAKKAGVAEDDRALAEVAEVAKIVEKRAEKKKASKDQAALSELRLADTARDRHLSEIAANDLWARHSAPASAVPDPWEEVNMAGNAFVVAFRRLNTEQVKDFYSSALAEKIRGIIDGMSDRDEEPEKVAEAAPAASRNVAGVRNDLAS